MGHRGQNRQKNEPSKQPCQFQEWWNSIWVVQDTILDETELGDLQPNVEIGGDKSLFTRESDPHNPDMLRKSSGTYQSALTSLMINEMRSAA